MKLVHYTRAPPGLKGDLKPDCNDISDKFIQRLEKRALKLYENRNFIFTIPEEALETWEKSGQLDELFDTLVIDWSQKSVQKWLINAEKLDLSDALVRETYFFAPTALGIPRYGGLSNAQKEHYDSEFARCLNSVMPFSMYKGDFKNPEILLPFEISRDYLKLEEVID